MNLFEPEKLLLLIVLGLLIFGPKRILELARSFGRMTGEFKKEKLKIENEMGDIKEALSLETKKVA